MTDFDKNRSMLDFHQKLELAVDFTLAIVLLFGACTIGLILGEITAPLSYVLLLCWVVFGGGFIRSMVKLLYANRQQINQFKEWLHNFHIQEAIGLYGEKRAEEAETALRNAKALKLFNSTDWNYIRDVAENIFGEKYAQDLPYKINLN